MRIFPQGSKTPEKKSFRPDINGLRAWAVAVVVLYHFHIPGFSGGFLGVDIFFVISGFLMTGIIVQKLNDGKLRGWKIKSHWLLDFYFARATRIIPALLFLIATLSLFGWFFLPAPDFKNLAKYAVSAIAFLSNIQFLAEAGYFDTASHEKLLLHTWSLSVEWQFYIFFPILVLFFYRFSRSQRSFLITIILAFSISLFLSIFFTKDSPARAFFLLTTRSWEMLAGSIIYLIRNIRLSNINRKILEFAGFFLILIGIFSFSPEDLWPSWRALIPVTGSALVLLSNRPDSIFTRSSVAQWLGNASYSIYLWHWPIAVLLLYGGWEKKALPIVLSLIITLFFSAASYYFVERPSRIVLGKNYSFSKYSYILSISIAILGLNYLVYYKDGFPNDRLPPLVEAIAAESANRNPRVVECFGQSAKYTAACTYGGNTPGVIVLGDSHAASVVRAVERSLPSKQLYVLDLTMSACPTVFGIHSKSSPRCTAFLDEAERKIKTYPASVPLIIVNRTSYYLAGDDIVSSGGNKKFSPEIYFTTPLASTSPDFFRRFMNDSVETICKFAKERPTYLVRPLPEMPGHVANIMARGLIFNHELKHLSIPLSDYVKRNSFALEIQDHAAKKCGVTLLDPLPYLCKNGSCKGDNNGLPIYFDDDHLNERGGDLLEPMFRKVLVMPR